MWYAEIDACKAKKLKIQQIRKSLVDAQMRCQDIAYQCNNLVWNTLSNVRLEYGDDFSYRLRVMPENIEERISEAIAQCDAFIQRMDSSIGYYQTLNNRELAAQAEQRASDAANIASRKGGFREWL